MMALSKWRNFKSNLNTKYSSANGGGRGGAGGSSFGLPIGFSIEFNVVLDHEDLQKADPKPMMAVEKCRKMSGQNMQCILNVDVRIKRLHVIGLE
jgi:hypothetical protein